MHRDPPPLHRGFAKSMRAQPTDAERRLWRILRAHRLGGLKFKRQVPMEGYIIDFVCFEAHLIVEVDGGQHAESARDAERDSRLAALGFRTLRVWNNDVLDNPEGVAAAILTAARTASGVASHAAAAAPPRGAATSPSLVISKA
jgi:very-short-patch-repair endonuclease